MTRQETISPIDDSIYVSRELADEKIIQAVLQRARKTNSVWRQTPIEERADICRAFVKAFANRTDDIALEIAWQMGRPVHQARGEVAGVVERSNYMIDVGLSTLADIDVNQPMIADIKRFIRKNPVGTVLVLAPWNYPYLTAINAIIPAIMAGNTVILKHSSQTPLCAEQLDKAFKAAGLPEGVFQFLHMSHEHTEKLIVDDGIDFVAFTGSVAGGRAIVAACAKRFVGSGLELGGKDPAYVCHDAQLDHAISSLVDGAFFNAGQSCCGIERIYVDEKVYDNFVAGFVELTHQYQLGSPLDASTTLGPMVRTQSADAVREQIHAAIKMGATTLIDANHFPQSQMNTPYLAPQVVIHVNHDMAIMREENFGPVVGIMKVSSDDQAIQLMNDSQYGLTASIWTQDQEKAFMIGDQVETGTWFMNRCDYLDPALAWTGVKHSGRGASLSMLGYEQLTQLKSFHLRTLKRK